MRSVRLVIVSVLVSLLAWQAEAKKPSFESPDSALMAAHPDRLYYEPITHYTIGDFFSSLDLPTNFGVAYTPSKIESVSFYAKMCLEWRLRKNYGWFGSVGVDNHSCFFNNIQMKDHYHEEAINVVAGEIWYYDLILGVGYRFPLVKDIREFYKHPYFHKFDIALMVQPGATIPHTKHVEVTPTEGSSEVRYALKDRYNIVPSMKFSAAFEWFVSPKFSIMVETAYIQHLMPTMLEKGYHDYDTNPKAMYMGPLVFNIGFAGFFN
ncbi:MAG: hypothetical protein IKN59_08135 [Paludibacteraceae bacterium]|nr:hypothetical protein [Paludibacteraceae bacterium]